MEQRVSISVSGGVADVRLVRADKMNALDVAMFEALVAATERLSKEKGLRAVVLSGEGRAFCAGLDMGRFAAMKEKGGNGVRAAKTAISPSALTGRPISRSRRCGAGGSCRFRSLPRFRASPSAAAFSSRSAPTCACSHPMRECRSWRSNGVWFPTWRARRSSPRWCATIFARSDLYRPDLLGAGGAELRTCNARL